jgi:hypothetical protein
MSSPLVPTVRVLLDRLKTQPEGTKVLQEYDQLLQFSILDGMPFYVDIKGGKVTVTEGTAAPRPLMEAHEYKGRQEVLEAFFAGKVRMSDAIHEGQLFPVAAHTTKRHIDHWVAKLVRIGLGQPSLRDMY